MRTGINKKQIIWIGVIIFLIVLAKRFINNSSVTCDEKCQELKYYNMINLDEHNKYGIELYKMLKGLKIKNNQDTIVSIKELFGDEFIKVTLVERMSVDYNKKCEDFAYNEILKDKDFCQLGIIEFKDGKIGYILGMCEHDLMGFTKSYDKIGFELTGKIQYLLPNDQVQIEYSSSGRQEFSITSKDYKIVSTNCN